MFKRSAESLKELRTITTTGILLAMAVAIRSLAIHITPDLRIIFTFVPLCVIAMLYGPVVSGMSAVALDIIGYIIDNRGARGYSPQIAAVVLLGLFDNLVVGFLFGLLAGLTDQTRAVAVVTFAFIRAGRIFVAAVAAADGALLFRCFDCAFSITVITCFAVSAFSTGKFKKQVIFRSITEKQVVLGSVAGVLALTTFTGSLAGAAFRCLFRISGSIAVRAGACFTLTAGFAVSAEMLAIHITISTLS